MYLIALCDDEPTELDKTEKLLSDYEKEHNGLEFAIRCFENAEELLMQIGEEAYRPDLIFMDIYLPDRYRSSSPSGMDAARRLRGMDYKGKIIFLTTSREHALDAYDVNAVQYIVKPVTKERLFPILDQLLKDIEEEQKKYILLRIEGRHVRIAVNHIVFCEAQGKTQCLHLADGSRCVLRLTMAEIYKQLARYEEFVRIGAGFIVNLDYVASLDAKEVWMDNGVKIYLPRGTFNSLKEQYFNYYCREDNFLGGG